MNKEDVLQMKPGRDLDIKVALEIMGYVWLKHLLQFSAELAVKWLGTPADIEAASGMYTLVTDSQFLALKEREDFAEAVLHFSTDMEASQQVIQRMEQLGYQYHLDTEIEQGSTTYYVCFRQSEILADERSMGFTSLPEAITKVALTTNNKN